MKIALGTLTASAAILISLCVPMKAANTKNEGLVAYPDLLYYKMLTEHAQIQPPIRLTDSSTNGATGTVFLHKHVLPPYINVLPEWTNNAAGIAKALHFNGVATYVETSNSSSFNFTTNSFTINLWLLPLTEGGYVMENGIYKTNGWYLRIADGCTRIQFGAETNGVDNVIMTDGVNTWPTTSWHMVTITRDGTNTPLIYLDGGRMATTGPFANPASSTNSLIFGVRRLGANDIVTGGTNNYDGHIWLTQIWAAALPAASVALLYTNQLSGVPWP